MIPLAPTLTTDERCPRCEGPLAVTDWLIPGMRPMARTLCTSCGRSILVDLPCGQALYSPMRLDPLTGDIFDRVGVPWYADWLREAYADRNAEPVALEVRRLRPIARPVVLLDCIDVLYGHALLKLLNAPQYLRVGEIDVVVLIQPFLAGLVPDGVAEQWVVDLPLSRGAVWSDGLAERIAGEAQRIGELHLAPACSHPHPSSFSISDFSRIAPFQLDRWREIPPAVTFIWRDDRVWAPPRRPPTAWLSKSIGRTDPLTEQTRGVAAFMESLRRPLPGLDAAVAGLGEPEGLPAWITDLRTPRASAGIDRQWLQRYAESHLVLGVHGSSMLLPTAHAGAALEIIGADRAGNFMQDIIFNGVDARDLFFRYRFVPPEISPEALAELSAFIISRYPDYAALMGVETSRDPHAAGAADVRH